MLSPLRDKDRSAWKLGLLNEAKVLSVIKAVVKGVGYELVHCWSVGLLRDDDNTFAATSLDGWLIVKEDESMDEDYCQKEDLFGDDSDVDLEYDSGVDETMSNGSSANDSEESILVSKFVVGQNTLLLIHHFSLFTSFSDSNSISAKTTRPFHNNKLPG